MKTKSNIQAKAMLLIKIPKALHNLIKQTAKHNKRRIQDEFTKRLQMSFNNQEALVALRNVLSPAMKKVYAKTK